MKYFKFDKSNQIGYFHPKTWEFWRSLITAFCIICILGHILEFSYCIIIDNVFDIIENDYAVWSDPIYHPYWVYGFGAIFMTFIIEPVKEQILKRRKTLKGAILQTFLVTVVISAWLELIFGLLINQPDQLGNYPYWDNSHLPFNILGQAWLVNDIFIGLGATIYVWFVYPLICEFYKISKNANLNFIIILICFSTCCLLSYSQLFNNGAFNL